MAALIVIGVLTLRPAPDMVAQAARTPIYCLVCGSAGLADIILNILLFGPLGLGLCLLGWRHRSAVAAGLVLSLCIELLQFMLIPGRDASVSDVLTNTAGTGLGWLLGAHWGTLLRPSAARRAWLAPAAAVAWLVVYGAAGWALGSWGPGGTYWAQWAHAFPGRDRFAGRVIEARLDGINLPDGQVDDRRLRPRLARGEYDLLVRFSAGAASQRDAPIFGLGSEPGDRFLEWRQHGSDYELDVAGRAASIRLKSPSLVLPGAAAAQTGTPLVLMARRHAGVMSVELQGSGSRAALTERLTPGLGWTLLSPWGRALSDQRPGLRWLWLGLTALPAGYWLSGIPRRRQLAIVAGLLVGTLLIGRALQLPLAPAGELVGAAGGLLAGVALSRGFNARGAVAKHRAR